MGKTSRGTIEERGKGSWELGVSVLVQPAGNFPQHLLRIGNGRCGVGATLGEQRVTRVAF
ncbi:hypothetical protein Mal15_36560 [Stieleria maiorica]|uniref:Uncharacterized protein n=1 Tax=Stieleria maiorica TaxID=2795974 RepID=A0A5B9MHW9_9BACT|nr:hypothetical protein Mal15_36560 [Stieleria maiorica]